MAINVILKTENIPMKKESLKKLPGVTVKNALENRGPTQPATKCGTGCLAETRLQSQLLLKNKKEGIHRIKH